MLLPKRKVLFFLDQIRIFSGGLESSLPAFRKDILPWKVTKNGWRKIDQNMLPLRLSKMHGEKLIRSLGIG
jgi:hypothetical protein